MEENPSSNEKPNSSLYHFALTTFATLGIGFSIVFFIIPVFSIYQVFKSQIPLKKISKFGLIFNYILYFLWFIFGDKLNLKCFKVCNLLGSVFSLLYLYVYYHLKYGKSQRKKVLSYFGILFSALLLGIAFFEIADDTDFIGFLAMIINIIIFGYPLKDINEFCKTKNQKLFNRFKIYTCLMCCSCWVSYGILVEHGKSIIIANSFGLFCSLVQIFTLYFGKNKKLFGVEQVKVNKSSIEKVNKSFSEFEVNASPKSTSIFELDKGKEEHKEIPEIVV